MAMTLSADQSSFTALAVLKRLRETGMSNLWVPDERDCFAVPEFPVLGSGKLDLQRLKDVALERLSGHEHNFQHASYDGIDYFVTGAGSKVRKGMPNGFEAAHTRSWSDHAHFLHVTIDARRMVVRAIGEPVDGRIDDLQRWTPDGRSEKGPIEIATP